MNEKKVFTMEDNVRSITFTLKDIAKHLASIDIALQALGEKTSQKKDEDLPF